jgi:hypothetical protein
VKPKYLEMKKIWFLLFVSLSMQAQKGYPTPKITDNHLFYIQHSKNHNTFVYEANFDDSKFDDTEPIKIHRVAYTKGGVKEELTKIQRKLAYGVDVRKLKENHYEFTLVSYPDKKLYLELGPKDKPQVKTVVNGKKMILVRMYLSMEESKSIKPKVEYIDFYGIDPETKKEIKERFFMK